MNEMTHTPTGWKRLTSRLGRRISAASTALLMVCIWGGLGVGHHGLRDPHHGGLVNAFSSVGQNLFGAAVFDAATVPPNPVLPQGAVQMDVALDTRIPTFLGVFQPIDPCHKFVQLEVQDGNVTIAVDFAHLPDGVAGHIVDKSLEEFPPSVDRCTAPTVDAMAR